MFTLHRGPGIQGTKELAELIERTRNDSYTGGRAAGWQVPHDVWRLSGWNIPRPLRESSVFTSISMPTQLSWRTEPPGVGMPLPDACKHLAIAHVPDSCSPILPPLTCKEWQPEWHHLDNLHSVAVPGDHSLVRCDGVVHVMPHVAKRSVTPVHSTCRSHASVEVVVVDSTSRFSFLQRAPRTLSVLERIGRDLSTGVAVYDFARFTAVGDGTRGCADVLLVGTHDRCVDLDLRASHLTSVFSDSGYVTSAQVDVMTDIGYWGHEGGSSCFKPYNFTSFADHSVDYGCGVGARWDLHPTKNDPNRKMIAGAFVTDHMFSYLRLLHDEYKGTPLFALVHTMSNHEATQSALAGMDEGLSAETLDVMRRSDTYLILLSDHGIRYGAVRQSPAGRHEEANPFLWVLAPVLLETPGRLVTMFRNQDKLVSMYDVYVTLSQLPSHRSCSDSDVAARHRLLKQHAAPGQDLFEDLVSGGRSCSDAGVPAQHCEDTRYESLAVEPPM